MVVPVAVKSVIAGLPGVGAIVLGVAVGLLVIVLVAKLWQDWRKNKEEARREEDIVVKKLEAAHSVGEMLHAVSGEGLSSEQVARMDTSLTSSRALVEEESQSLAAWKVAKKQECTEKLACIAIGMRAITKYREQLKKSGDEGQFDPVINALSLAEAQLVGRQLYHQYYLQQAEEKNEWDGLTSRDVELQGLIDQLLCYSKGQNSQKSRNGNLSLLERGYIELRPLEALLLDKLAEEQTSWSWQKKCVLTLGNSAQWASYKECLALEVRERVEVMAVEQDKASLQEYNNKNKIDRNKGPFTKTYNSDGLSRILDPFIKEETKALTLQSKAIDAELATYFAAAAAAAAAAVAAVSTAFAAASMAEAAAAAAAVAPAAAVSGEGGGAAFI
jgi:hypothetical protein